MNAPISLAQLMTQATALTRQGRLAEATHAIRRALNQHQGMAGDERPVDTPSPELAGLVLDGLVREVEDDPAPPAAAPFTPPPAESGHPGPAARRASFDTHLCVTPHGQRQYKLFVPACLGDEPAPLIVMLHGCKQNPDDFAAGTRMNELAEEQGFRVLYPAQAARSNVSGCWNWFQPADQARGCGEPALLAEMVREVIRTHAVDAGRVYVAGLSAGGAMAAILASEYPDLFAAAGVHSGLPPGSAHDVASAFAAMKQGPKTRKAAPAAHAPWIVFHGDRDDTVHPVNGEQLMRGTGVIGDTSSELGRATGGQAYVRTVQRDGQGRSVAEHWLVKGMGHAWSGGSPAGSYTEPRGPDASREMLRFFAQHRRG